MQPKNCLECDTLWQDYVSATMARVHLESKLQLAKLVLNRNQISVVTAQLDAAKKIFESAFADVRDHELLHKRVVDEPRPFEVMSF